MMGPQSPQLQSSDEWMKLTSGSFVVPYLVNWRAERVDFMQRRFFPSANTRHSFATVAREQSFNEAISPRFSAVLACITGGYKGRLDYNRRLGSRVGVAKDLQFGWTGRKNVCL